MNTAPYTWLEKIEEGLSVLTNIPLWGHIPPFPWETFSAHLKEVLKLSDLHISVKESHILAPEDFLSGMGSHPILFAVEMGTLSEPLFWMMSQEDVSKLASWALCGSNKYEGFSNHALQEGFYRYLCLEALSSIAPAFNMTFKMIATPPLPETSSLSAEIAIVHNSETLAARLITSNAFQKEMSTYFAKRKYSLIEGSQGLEVPLSLEIGHTVLSLSDWESVQPGDVVFFDNLSYDLESEKAGVTVVLGTTPLFLARFKQHKLTILDYAFYQEEETAMDSENDRSEEINEEQEGEPMWSESSSEGEDVSKLISSQDVPLNLVVEIGRLRMNVEKLLQLQPGNILDLGVRPEQGVSITVNGSRVARAELVQIGEVLGLKILEIG